MTGSCDDRSLPIAAAVEARESDEQAQEHLHEWRRRHVARFRVRSPAPGRRCWPAGSASGVARRACACRRVILTINAEPASGMWPKVHTSRCPDSVVTNQPRPVGMRWSSAARWPMERERSRLLHILSSVLKLSGTPFMRLSSWISNFARSLAVDTRPVGGVQSERRIFGSEAAALRIQPIRHGDDRRAPPDISATVASSNSARARGALGAVEVESRDRAGHRQLVEHFGGHRLSGKVDSKQPWIRPPASARNRAPGRSGSGRPSRATSTWRTLFSATGNAGHEACECR